jgi:hypothetical protein
MRALCQSLRSAALVRGLILTSASLPLVAQDAPAIMSAMAANIEKATGARQRFVYEQSVRSSLVRRNGKVSRWEKRRYTVLPAQAGTEKKLTSFAGEYRKGNRMYPYSEPGFKYKDVDLDGALLSDLTSGLVDDKKSRDGIPHDLFPLRSADLRHYQFTLKGESPLNGRRAYEIAFEPARKENCIHVGGDSDNDCDGTPWKGTVWVDAEELQPVRILTDLAANVPWAIRTFLGTNLRQVGFTVNYRRIEPNVWFPATYGTEFRFNVLWGYKRTITLSLESDGFRKTDVTSTVGYDLPR